MKIFLASKPTQAKADAAVARLSKDHKYEIEQDGSFKISVVTDKDISETDLTSLRVSAQEEHPPLSEAGKEQAGFTPPSNQSDSFKN